jgi:hypothetical protein
MYYDLFHQANPSYTFLYKYFFKKTYLINSDVFEILIIAVYYVYQW